MLVRCTGSLGRCGAAISRRPSFSPASLPSGWYPGPGLWFEILPFYKLRCYYHKGPGSWTNRGHLVRCECKRYLWPIWSLACLRGSPGWAGFHIYGPPWHTKKLTHDRHWILIPVEVNDMVLYSRSHFLPVNRRKSRSNPVLDLSISVSPYYYPLM